MNKKNIEELFERSLGENKDIHIDMEVRPYSNIHLEPHKENSYHTWVEDGSFDLKDINIYFKKKDELIAAVRLVLFAEEDIKDLGFDKVALYLDDVSGSLSHITNMLLDEAYRRRCCSYSYNAKHCMPFSGELRTLYVAKPYRKQKLGCFILDNLNPLLEYEFRLHICSLVVFLHPFLNDVYLGGYTDYHNQADRNMLEAMTRFYLHNGFKKFTYENQVYLKEFN